ncbi:MAG: hypothetical protein KDC66_02325 [Phaeodactylibacter sp.]|nr:hypothetical protein [Phaeodactylibacter sp.]MCB9272631.1 hypothetical protein [Lewinellaceae bacterium]
MEKKLAFTGALALILLTSSLARAQEPAAAGSAQSRAVESINQLKAGTLLVRLPSQQAKIDAMQQVMASSNTSEAARDRLKSQIETTITNQRVFNLNMVQAFQEAYDFSKALFFYDTNTSRLKSGDQSGIFLDNNLEADPSIRPGDGPFFILHFGSTSSETSDGVEAMIILDSQFERLEKPFPFYQRLNDFSAFIGSFLPKPNQKTEDALRIVGKLNKKLHTYFQQAQAGKG